MRGAAVTALVALLQGADYQNRIDAGRALVGFAADPRAEKELTRALADDADAAVTEAIAGALLRRNDSPGLAIVAAGLDRSDASHSDAIHNAVLEVFAIYAQERDGVIAVLAKINPLLRPREKQPFSSSLAFSFRAEVAIPRQRRLPTTSSCTGRQHLSTFARF